MTKHSYFKSVDPLVTYISEPHGIAFVTMRAEPDGTVLNARDLGGLPVGREEMVAYGKFIRGGRLYKLKDKGEKILREYGVTTVIDLRMDEECRDKPDDCIEGVEYVRIPLVCTATAGITHGKNMAKIMFRESRRIKNEFADVDEYMASVYENILFSESTRDALKLFFEKIFNAKGAIYFHCAGGKDRAGLCAMLIEYLLGVDRELIVYDYMYSRKSGKGKRRWSKFGLTVLPFPRRFRAILFGMMNAKESYIKSALDSIDSRYGSIDEYLTQALGVSEEQIKAFRATYVVPRAFPQKFHTQ